MEIRVHLYTGGARAPRPAELGLEPHEVPQGHVQELRQDLPDEADVETGAGQARGTAGRSRAQARHHEPRHYTTAD